MRKCDCCGFIEGETQIFINPLTQKTICRFCNDFKRDLIRKHSKHEKALKKSFEINPNMFPFIWKLTFIKKEVKK